MTQGCGQADQLGLLQQAQLVRSGDVSALDLVDQSIDRIETFDGSINAVVHRRFDAARREAAAVSSNDPRPFAGVPILTKDLGCGIVGEPDYQGAALLASVDARIQETSVLVKQLQRAGMILIGRTNVPEFGLACTSDNRVFGPTRNPYDEERVAGGSSGGAAAAVAMGYVSTALGSDGGGSIRMPAAICGVVGLKPSRGLLAEPLHHATGLFGHLTYGPLTRSVRDARALLSVLMGSDLKVPRDRAQRCRIGIVEPDALRLSDSREATVALMRAENAIRSIGLSVIRSHPDALNDDGYVPHFVGALSPLVSALISELVSRTERSDTHELVHPITDYWVGQGRQQSAEEHVGHLHWLEQYTSRMLEWWRNFDILIAPVIPGATPHLEQFHNKDAVPFSLEMVRLAAPFNSTGQPACAVPVGMLDGLPVGVQLIGKPGDDALVLDVAAQLEEAIFRIENVTAEALMADSRRNR